MSTTNEMVSMEPSPERTSDACYMSDALDLIGGKWPVLVLGTLMRGTLRYTELRRAIDGISQRQLTLALKGLEENGLVKRTTFAIVPPRVDYELTALARTLVEPLHAMKEWARVHGPELRAARAAYAKRR